MDTTHSTEKFISDGAIKAGKRLAALGGTEPTLADVPRPRDEPQTECATECANG